MISEKDYNEIYLKGYEDGKNDNDNLKISYENKPSFTKRKIKELQQERDLYKEVIEEVREYIEDWLFDAGGNGASMTYEDINELLQILDKVIGFINNDNKTTLRI